MSESRHHRFRGKTHNTKALEDLMLHVRAAGSALVHDDGSSLRAKPQPSLSANRRDEGRLPHRRGTQRFAHSTGN